jgi:predicted metalloprotease with PDZ domain
MPVNQDYMKKRFLLAFATLFTSVAMAQQDAPKAIYYAISFPNAAHHEAEVTITIPQAPAQPLLLRMSRSSAGRYATHEFGKNIHNVAATDVNGKPLELTQVEGDVYKIEDHPATVKVSYTLFGNYTDGTYTSIDLSHAHLNMPSTFMWVAGLDKRPLTFQFNDLDKYGWRVATQLKHEDKNVYSAPNMQYMMDCPTELSDYRVTSWEAVNPDNKKLKINLTVHSDDSQEVIDNFGKMVARMTQEEKAVFGEYPVYDYGEYTFISDINPAAAGDGMEHRNSTCITIPAPKVGGLENRLLGVFAHEYFHSWNVKRIRPKSLEPFNFEHANMSNELWFAEGFTQYYGELLLERSGFVKLDDYTWTVASLVNQVLNTPGAAKYPATQMSRYAVFADAGVSIDPNNNANDYTSYYTYGGAIALALDLRLRSDFNLTLDDYMHQVWISRGKVMKPYTVPDLQSDLAKVTGNAKFAAEFFKKYITGIDKNNYEELLAKAGLVLRRVDPGKGWAGSLAATAARGRAGLARTANAEGLPIQSSTIMGTPVYKAGLDAGDVIMKVNGVAIKDQKGFDDQLTDKKPGDKLTVNYKNRTGDHETIITLEENPNFEVVTFEKAGKTLSKEQETFRNNWLQSKVK